MSLVSNLDQLLQERDWSGRELSRRSGLHRDTVSAWRRGVPARFERATLEMLLESLGCALPALLTDQAQGASPAPPQERKETHTARPRPTSPDERIAQLEAELAQIFSRREEGEPWT